MRDRHNWAGSKHPKTCSCIKCENKLSEIKKPLKKKRKAKSLRGSKKKIISDDSSNTTIQDVDEFLKSTDLSDF